MESRVRRLMLFRLFSRNRRNGIFSLSVVYASASSGLCELSMM